MYLLERELNYNTVDSCKVAGIEDGDYIVEYNYSCRELTIYKNYKFITQFKLYDIGIFKNSKSDITLEIIPSVVNTPLIAKLYLNNTFYIFRIMQ